ncbi:hypothetical protein EL18_01251 [Nitratireductor basaltis]|uniref:Uncharacterized protein n=1 Tax=Nitratireductor basaltis TaxID=472175 RepID=A0A084UB85_9HYPH|nr:hypothetical protein EL18_01251 [Nitratireductor basaltis]
MEAGSRNKAETLEYLQAMLGQLLTMARAERCETLAYFIEMAYIECSDTIRQERPGGSALVPLHQQ